MGICCSTDSITSERTFLPIINIDDNSNNDNILYLDTKQKYIDEYNIWICNNKLKKINN